MQMFVQLVVENKQICCGQIVSNYLDYCFLIGQLVVGVDSNQYEVYVGYGGVGDQVFNIGLGEGYLCVVEDIDYVQLYGDGCKFGGGIWEQWQCKVQQVVGGGFQQDFCEVDRVGGWCLGVSVWQLVVQWYYWYFYCEGDEEVEYQQVFYVVRYWGFQQIFIVEGLYVGGVEVDEGQCQNGNQYYQIVCLGIDEEFGGCCDMCFIV